MPLDSQPEPGPISDRAAVGLAFAINAVVAVAAGALVFWLFHAHPVAYVFAITEDYWGENASFIAWAVAFALFVWAMWHHRTLRTWGVGVLCAFALFCGGEEIAWGEQIFHFRSPAFWAARNAQGEITLHNLMPDNLEDYLKPVLGALLLVWVLLWPVVANRWAGLRRWLTALGLPTVPVHLFPLFVLSAAFLIFTPTLKGDEWSELFLAVTMAVYAADLGWTRSGRGQRIRVWVTLLVLLSLVGSTVAIDVVVRDPKELSRRLNIFAAYQFPQAGMRPEARQVFDYLEEHPSLANDRTDLEYALFLLAGGDSAAGRSHLERALAIQDSLGRTRPRDPVLHRNAAEALRVLGRADEAKAQLGQAARIDSIRIQGTRDPNARAVVLWSLAQTMADEGDAQAAATQIHRALALATTRPLRRRLTFWLAEQSQPLATGPAS